MRRLARAALALAPLALASALLVSLAAGAAASPPRLPPVQVAPGGHRLLTADGRPFFWLADTAWNLAYRTTDAEADAYLTKRAAQGFDVVQMVVLAEQDGIRTATDGGLHPFIGGDPDRPDPAFFDHIARIVDAAAARGIYVALLPAWGDKLTAPWGDGPRLFTASDPARAERYGRFIAHRLCGRSNVIWVLGGDRPATLAGPPEGWWARKTGVEAGFGPDEDWRPIWRAMARGVAEGACTPPLLMYHPQGGAESTSQLMPGEGWLAVNGLQSGHGAGRDTPVWRLVARDWAVTPPKPVVDLEMNYEDHPVNPWPTWDPASGYFRDHDIRKQAYRSVFAGAAGVTYGHHAVWQFAGARHPGINHADRGWVEAMDRPGAAEIHWLRDLIASRPAERVPATALIVDNGEGARHAEATRDPAGRWALVYIPAEGQGVTLDLPSLGRARLATWWFDPRTGAARRAGVVAADQPRVFTPPPGGPDWVLALDDPAAGYRPPGVAGP